MRAFPVRRTATAFLAMVFGSLGLVAAAGEAPKKPEDEREPPMQFVLEIDGKPLSIAADTPVEAQVGGRRVAMKLSIKPYRIFERPGIRFAYPRQYTFEATSAGADSTTWVFSGNENKLLLTGYRAVLEEASLRKELVAAVMAQYAQSNPKQSDVSLRLGDKPYRGDRIDVVLVGHRLRQDIFTITAPKASFVLIVQDSPKEDGSPSEETVRATALLSETFELPKSGK